MASERITPRTLKGFRDYLPEAMIPRERLIESAKAVYRSFGFRPIDTPAMEYTEVLLGKGGGETDKQLYRFEDKGGRDVGLRFDLTVPLSRIVAQHAGQLERPYKRYHPGPVWRGENTQRGRYREFVQCDFDTIGTESVLADTETVLVIHELFRKLGFERFSIHLNHRKLLAGALESIGLSEHAADVLRALDKRAKIGDEAVAKEMAETAGATDAQSRAILELVSVQGSNDEVLAAARERVADSERGREGAELLAQVLSGMRAAGVAEECVVLDLSIARGLDYYTGTVFETVLDDLPGIGSVCSGGRYDDLASTYTKLRLPGVGASLGVDRLLAAMEELELLEARPSPADLFLPLFDAQRSADYLALATRLRRAGISVELYPDAKKLGAQLKHADRCGHRLALVVGESEWAAGTGQLKDLVAGTSEEVTLDGLEATLHARLSS